MILGDARSGKLADNIAGFGRALRRAGVPVDAARIGLAQEAVQLVGLARRDDVGAALESVMVSREQDRGVFRELFAAWFRDPEVAHKLLAQMLPSAAKAEPVKRRPRVSEALAQQQAFGRQPARADEKIELDAAMTASDRAVLRHADFNALSASEYRLVERLAREIALPVPALPSRRTRPGVRGSQLHWARTLRQASRTGGELVQLRRLRRTHERLPLLVLVDVSGSMERYARLLLAFLHASTRGQRCSPSAPISPTCPAPSASPTPTRCSRPPAARSTTSPAARGWAPRWRRCASATRAGWWAAARWCC
jgi:uncharacterized protein